MEMKSGQARRRWKYGSNALILTISLLGLLVLAYLGLREQQWRFDFTANRDQTLAPQTVELLAGLKQPLKIRAFFRPQGDMDQIYIRRKVDDVLQEYAKQNKQIDYRMIDPDIEQQEALAYGIQSDGTIVFQVGERRKDIYQSNLFDYPNLNDAAMPLFVGESLFTNAIFSLLEGQSPTLCLTQGHGERSMQDAEADGLQRLAGVLTAENYRVEAISLTDVAWQKQCDVLIVAGARQGFPEQEDAALKAYIESGKRMVLLLEPQTTLGLDQTLGLLGVSVQNAVIFDAMRHFVLGPHYPAPELLDHPITSKLKQAELSPVFYLAVPLKIASKAPYQATPFLQSSGAAWGETKLKSEEKPVNDPGVDLPGPLTMAVAVTRQPEVKQPAEKNDEPKASPVALVFGDSNFVTNGLLNIPGNQDLFLNGLAWLLDQSERVSIRPTKPDFRPLILSPEQISWFRWVLLVLYPALFLCSGLFYVWKRKRV